MSLEALEDRVVPAQTWYVDLLSDTGSGKTNQGDLRYCVNNAQNGDTILFAVSGTIHLGSELAILNNITIDGNGQGVEIWGGNNRVFDVAPNTTAEIDNLSIDDGYMSGGNGGGLLNEGTLTLKGDSFLNNQAVALEGLGGGNGGAIYNADGATLIMEAVSLNGNSASSHGGGIDNEGDLTCKGNCSIVQNKASDGGGIENGGSALFEQGIQISGNQATSLGGGIRNDSGKVTVTGWSGSAGIQYNSAPAGGGIYNAGGTLWLAPNVTVYKNQAKSGNGGGILEGGGTVNVTLGNLSKNSALNGSGTSGCGGGIYVVAGILTLRDDLIGNNTAQTNGAGLYNSGGTVKMVGGTIETNTADDEGGGVCVSGGNVTLSGVLVDGNAACSQGGGLYNYGGSVIVSGGSFQNNTAGVNGGGIYNGNKGKLTLQNGVTIGKTKGSATQGGNSASSQGGGLYLAAGSTTTFGACTVDGNQASSGEGIGVYWENTAQVNLGGLTDNDDPKGIPYQGP